MPPRPASEDRRWERTRRALLEGGRRVLSEQGVDRATVKQIVAEAGVSQPSFYNHFQSKEELLEAILLEFFAADGRRKRGIFERTQDPAEALALNIRTSLHIASQDPLVAWMVVRAGPARNLLRQTGADPLAAALRAGIRAGRFDACDAEIAAASIRGATFPVLQKILEGNAREDVDVAFAQLMLRMLGVPLSEAADIAARPLPPQLLLPPDVQSGGHRSVSPTLQSAERGQVGAGRVDSPASSEGPSS